MGLFSSDTPKVFKNKDEIKKALEHIRSLDYRQKPVVMGALIRELDHGGVTRQEIKDVVRELKKNHVISETDEDELLELLKEDSEDED